MANQFREYNQAQQFLLPPDIREWVPVGSLAAYIDDLLETLGGKGRLQTFFAGYREDGWGNKAYHPVMMLKVLLYAYSKGITSSRHIAELLECDVHFRFLAANQTPDFRTISDFRKNHIEAFSALFVEVLLLCRESGLAKVGTVALDGHKVAGNAALDQNRTLEQLRTQVDALMAQAQQADLQEDKQFGEQRGDELPPGLHNHQERLERLNKALARLEQTFAQTKARQEEKIAQRESEEQAQGKRKRGRKPKTVQQAQSELLKKAPKANITDPDSRIMKGRRGYIQGYNGQAVVDCESQVIVAHGLTQQENDQAQLEPMLTACMEQYGTAPEQLLADAGYNSTDNATLEDKPEFAQTELYICQQKEWKERQAAASPASCTQEDEDTRTPEQVVAESPSEEVSAKERVRCRMETPEGKMLYKKRASTVEPVFGQMINRGLTRFNLRGVRKTSGEWSLWCLTHNILKLWRANCVQNRPAGVFT